MSADAPGSRPAGGLGWVGLAAVLALAAGSLALAFTSPDRPPDSDEAHHVHLGLKYERDLAAGDATAFVRHTAKGGARYPFAHGWAVAAAFLGFGQTLFVARATSAAALAAAIFFAVLLLRRLRPTTHPAWAVWIAAALALAPEVFQNSVICMLEIPGLALALLSVWAYHRFVERPGVGRGLLVALAVTALLFVKYPYGAYLYVPICVHELYRVRGRVRELFARPSLAVWLPTALTLAVWLAIPTTRAGVVRLLADAPDAFVTDAGRDPGALPHVQPELAAFYARGLIGRLSASWVVGCALALGFLAMLVRGGAFERVVVAGSLVWTAFTLTLSFRTSGWDRFLVPLAGSFAVLGTVGFAHLFAWAHRPVGGLRGAVTRSAAILIVLAGVGEAAITRWPDLDVWAHRAVETTDEHRAGVLFVAQAVAAPANVLVVGAWDQLNEEAIQIEWLLSHPDAAFSSVDVKAIRRGRGLSGTDALVDWFETGSRSQPKGEARRARYVVVVRPTPKTLASIDEAVPDAARAKYDRVWAEIDAETTRRLEGSTLAATYPSPLATFEVHRLDDVVRH